MRKGRGLLDGKAYDAMRQIPLTRALLQEAVVNFRTDQRTGKACAEIHEDYWPLVKHLAALWRKSNKAAKAAKETP